LRLSAKLEVRTFATRAVPNNWLQLLHALLRHDKIAHDFVTWLLSNGALWTSLFWAYISIAFNTAVSAPRSDHIPQLIPFLAMIASASASLQTCPVLRVPTCETSRQQSCRRVYGQTGRCKLANGVRPSSTGRADRRSRLSVVSALPVGEVAVLPSLIPVLLRAFSAGLLLYSSLAWASARSDRKQVRQPLLLTLHVLRFESDVRQSCSCHRLSRT